MLYKIAHFDSCLAQTKSGHCMKKDPAPNFQAAMPHERGSN